MCRLGAGLENPFIRFTLKGWGNALTERLPRVHTAHVNSPGPHIDRCDDMHLRVQGGEERVSEGQGHFWLHSEAEAT